MIENLANLVRSASVERLSLSIQCSSPERVAVAVQTILGDSPEDKDESANQMQLRHALSKPILVEGTIDEVDAVMDKLLMKYVEQAKLKAGKLVTNIDEVTQALKEASTDEVDNEVGDGNKSVDEPAVSDSGDDDNSAYDEIDSL